MAGLAQSGGNDTPPLPDFLNDWPVRCQQLKQELAQVPGMDVRFTPMPEPDPMISTWSLDLFGLSIPLPAVEYQAVFVYRNPADSPPNIILLGQHRSSNDVQVTINHLPMDDRYEDLFAAAPVSGSPVASEAGREWTTRLFGGPVTHAGLVLLGFQHDPAELTCELERWETEIPISIGLIVKSVGSPAALRAVHPTPAEPPGWITRSQAGEATRWDLTVPSPGQGLMVSISVPTDSPLGEIGHLYFLQGAPQHPERPAWIDLLVGAIAADRDASRWNDLADALHTEGMSSASVERTRSMATEAAPPQTAP